MLLISFIPIPSYYTPTLLDIIPDIACFDEGGSRFIHKRLKLGTIEEQELAMKVALSAIEDLWSHHFGNFMLQGIFEFGTDEMKKELMEYIYNNQDVAALCVHMNGQVLYCYAVMSPLLLFSTE